MHADLFERYVRSPDQYRRALAGLSRDDLIARPGPGAWSIQELVIHVVDDDFVVTERMKRVVTEERPQLKAFDETIWIERLAPHDQSLDDAIAMFDLNHRQFLRTVRTLPPDAWSRVGVHSAAGEQSLAELFELSITHADHHLKFLLAKRERLGQPA